MRSLEINTVAAGPSARETGHALGREDEMTTGPTTRRRQLGAEMLRLRTRIGMTLEEAGAAVDVSRATVQRYEQQTGPVRWVIVDALCRAYKASDGEREAAVDLARNAKILNWWRGTGVPKSITTLYLLEDEAADEWIYGNTYVPGLLQTRAYALAAHQASELRATAEEIEALTDARMKRQDVLTRESAPHLWVILDESVLHRAVGGPAVMAEQLRHLASCMASPKITIQVLPFDSGAHAADTAGFIIVKGSEPSLDVVHIGILTGALYLEKPEEVERHRMTFDYLRAQSRDAAASFEMITKAAEQFAAR
jgi:transcriptional regulator with XRE-family HTH domain